MINFNASITINEIKSAYTSGIFPNAYCLLWNHKEYEELLITEFSSVVETEQSEGVVLDGWTRFHI